DGSDSRGGKDLSSHHDVMPASGMGSDVTIGEAARLIPTPDGRGVLFLAPHRGAMELWRLSIDGRRLDRLTDGRHYLSSFDAVPAGGGIRVAAIRSTPTELPGVVVGDLEAGGAHVALRPVADLNAE